MFTLIDTDCFDTWKEVFETRESAIVRGNLIWSRMDALDKRVQVELCVVNADGIVVKRWV